MPAQRLMEGTGAEGANSSQLDDDVRLHGEHESEASASLGVLRLNYQYPSTLGEINHSCSFAYPVRSKWRTRSTLRAFLYRK